MKRVPLIALLCGLVCTAAAQTSNTGAPGASECKLTLAQAPAIRGIRLGMNVDQVIAQIPGAESDANLLARLSRDNFGARNANVLPGSYATSKEKFAGINSINFTFLDGRLVSFTSHYEGIEWHTIEQFAARVAELMNLPGIGAWKPRNNIRVVSCDGFEISVQINAITMTDLTVDISKVLREREEVPKEKARRAFKP